MYTILYSAFRDLLFKVFNPHGSSALNLQTPIASQVSTTDSAVTENTYIFLILLKECIQCIELLLNEPQLQLLLR